MCKKIRGGTYLLPQNKIFDKYIIYLKFIQNTNKLAGCSVFARVFFYWSFSFVCKPKNIFSSPSKKRKKSMYVMYLHVNFMDYWILPVDIYSSEKKNSNANIFLKTKTCKRKKLSAKILCNIWKKIPRSLQPFFFFLQKRHLFFLSRFCFFLFVFV